MTAFYVVAAAFSIGVGISEGWTTELGFLRICFGIYIAADAIVAARSTS